jgi:pimeloyl-ACP methyl ester carboxylesterase
MSTKRRTSPYQTVAIRLAASVAPRSVERRVAWEFLRPRRLAPEGLRPDLPPPDEAVRLATGDEWVAAWRWGNGPAVLLVHGWEDDHSCFAALIERLTTRGQAVVAFDLPAHGASGGRRTALPAVANAVSDVAARLDPVRAIVGHSFGGAAATLAIAAGLEVERAVIMASPISVARVLDGVTNRLGLSSARRAGIEEDLVRRVGVPLELLELEPIAQRLDVPTLVVHSRDDRTVPFFAGVRLQRVWPGARLHAVDGLGHRRILADAGVLERIVGFLARDGRAAGHLAASA